MKYQVTTDANNYVLSIGINTNKALNTIEILDISALDKHLNAYKLINNNYLYLDENRLAEIVEAEEIKEREEAKAEEEAKLEADKVKMLTDMLLILREPSDKLGQDFLIYMLGNVELRREYVPSESHAGTIDDPIPFELGLELIPNAFYSYDAHLWVYMGQGGVTADDYPVDDVNGWALWE